MKTIKFLCIAIFGMVVWSAESLPTAASAVGNNVLDFDTIANARNNIPAIFQPKIYEPANYNAAGPNNLRYVYFTVFNSGEVEDGNFIHAVRRNPNQTEKNIFFPMDGHQPTTPEAVEYSCANIDNREDSPITEWYMKMFGVIPFQNVVNPAPHGYIKAGWSAPAFVGGPINAQSIISFDASVDDTPVDAPNIPGATISRRELFERAFRKIASTSVGRVLLYRILIEIRRHQANNTDGCMGSDIITGLLTPRMISARKNARSLKIKYNDSFKFHPISNNGGIVGHEILWNNTPPFLNVVANPYNGYDYITTYRTKLDVALLHEMIHWYHRLRNIYRSLLEQKPLLSDSDNFFVYMYYYGELSTNIQRKRISAIAWGIIDGNNDECVAIEEARTILGTPKYEGVIFNADSVDVKENYLEGDDLSENLYRSCVGEPLRLGHTTIESFYEDARVINKVRKTSNDNISVYNHKLAHYRLLDVPVDFTYGRIYNYRGMGMCEYNYDSWWTIPLRYVPFLYRRY